MEIETNLDSRYVEEINMNSAYSKDCAQSLLCKNLWVSFRDAKKWVKKFFSNIYISTWSITFTLE